MNITDSSSTNISLTRSLTKVKFKISSKLKISNNNNSANNNDDQIQYNENEQPVLKAMKYDDIADNHSQLSATGSNNLLDTRSSAFEDIKSIPKSISLTSMKMTDSQTLHSNISSKRGSNSSVEDHTNLEESIKSSRTSSLDVGDSSQLNNSLTTSSTIPNESEEVNTNHQETLLPPPAEPLSIRPVNTNRLLTPTSELRSPFNTIFEDRTLNVLSPPISPKRTNSVAYDPLNKLDQLQETTETIQFEPQATDFADAMALSILDKVDDAKNTEWKI